MQKKMTNLLKGYQRFRDQYVHGETNLLKNLAHQGQKPQAMVVACCDSRVDPALILQCQPGDLFIVRNVANIIPPYEQDDAHHGTSAALEFGLCHLHIPHLIILGHSQCGGINAMLNGVDSEQDDFISSWVSGLKREACVGQNVDQCAQRAIQQSYQNCLSFPWIQSRIDAGQLAIHQWFFDIKQGQLLQYQADSDSFQTL